MDTISQNSISYEGKVKVLLKRDSKTKVLNLHNSGTINLGLFFAKALVKSFDPNDAPHWLTLEYKFNESTWVSLSPSMVPLSGGTYFPQEENDSSLIGLVKFITVLQHSSLREGISNKTLRLVMYDNNYTKKPLAFIGGDTDSQEIQSNLYSLYEAINAGQDAIIEWQLQIHNKKASQAEEVGGQ